MELVLSFHPYILSWNQTQAARFAWQVLLPGKTSFQSHDTSSGGKVPCSSQFTGGKNALRQKTTLKPEIDSISWLLRFTL